MVANPYGLQRRRKPGEKASDIDDPAFRSRVVSFAATGMSRRGVAAAVGKPESTIRSWVERGAAFPDVEPWGSFSVDYRRAERGLEGAGASVVAMKVQLMVEQMTERLAWRDRGSAPVPPRKPDKPRKGASEEDRELYEIARDHYDQAQAKWELDIVAWGTPPEAPDAAELAWLDRVMEARFPEDWGTSKHRKPEAEFDAANYLDQNTMTREQLAALLADPPEPIRLALVDSAPYVYAVLVAGGFDPAAPRKAEHETE